MGLYDDFLTYAGEGLYDTDEDDPLFARFSSGEVPRPVEELYKGLGREDLYDQPSKIELDPWKILTTSEEWTPDHTARAGELLGAHTQDVGRSLALSLLSTSEYLNRMKEKYVPYYNESTAVRALSDAITKFGPGIMALERDQEVALSMLAESEYLKADPRALETHNWFEDVLSVGPQMGSMLLASMAGGPWAGFGMIGMQILGSTYDNLIQEGANPEDAYYWSVGNAVVQGALEMAPFSMAMKLFKPRFGLLRMLKGIGEIAGVEFFTEWFQAYPDSFVNIFATNPDKELWDRAVMFGDDIWKTTKQGMYEGTLTAPWALLMAPFGGVAGRIRDKKGRAQREEDEAEYYWRRMEEGERASASRAAPEGEFVPFTDEDIISRRAPSRAASSVTQAHLDMMTPEQQKAFRQASFKERFAELYASIPGTPEEVEARQKQALDVANQFASTLRIVGNDVFTRQPNLDDVQKERILQDMGLVQVQDQYSGALNQLGIIRGNGIPDRAVFDDIEPLALTREEYDRRANLLGTLSSFYTVDASQIPPDMRGAYALLAEQISSSEPKGVTFIEPGGEVSLAKGTAHGYGSSYPGWFKEPFTVRYFDSRIKKDESGKTVMEPETDSQGKPVMYAKGEKKGQQKQAPARELEEKKEDFKFGLNRKDFFDLIDKLDNGKYLTARQSAISDHIMGIAQHMKKSDPELFMQSEIDQLEADGYEIIGNSIELDRLDLGDQVVAEGSGYDWDTYTVVSEDDGAGNYVLDSLSDRIQAPPTEQIRAVGVKRNGYWKTMNDVGGPRAVSEAPRTLPGIKDIEPIHNLTNEYSVGQMEEDFAENLPDLAEFFENPEGIREQDKEDRRQSEVPVEEDGRSGIDRRENFMLTARVDKMTPAERDEALEYARKMATTDVLTGLYNNTALELHKNEFGKDIPFVAIDVDGLKYYNDMTKAGVIPTGEVVEGGHKLGNQILALMGRAMTEAAEITGISDRVKLYRFGGDEYGITGIDRDTVTRAELETLRLAIKDSASQIIVDMLGNDNIHYQLNGLAFSSATGGTIDNAISASEEIKNKLDSEYAAIIEKGKKKPTRARIPGTRVEVNYLPVGWSQGSEGLLASQVRANEKVGRSLGQAEPSVIDETIVDVSLSGPNWMWHPGDTVEDAVAWTGAQVRRLAKSDALPQKDAWNFILGELLYEAEDIGMPPDMLAHGVESGALQTAQQYLSNKSLGVKDEVVTETKAAPVPAVVEKGDVAAKVKPAEIEIVKEALPLITPKVPQLPAPPPKLMAPEVALAEALPSPEDAPTVKSRKAKFVRENIEYLPLGETVTVQYLDPTTGDIFETEESARDAFVDMEKNTNKFYELMECLKT